MPSPIPYDESASRIVGPLVLKAVKPYDDDRTSWEVATTDSLSTLARWLGENARPGGQIQFNRMEFNRPTVWFWHLNERGVERLEAHLSASSPFAINITQAFEIVAGAAQ